MNAELCRREAKGQIAVIEAWQGEQLVLTDRVALSVLGPVTYAPMIAGITRLRLTPEHRWQIELDDLRFGLGDGSAAKTAE